MSIINISTATRAGAHLLLGFHGESGTGKTFSALRVGRGMAGPTGKLGMLDTEAGRGRLYADAIPGGYDIGELTPPFTAERYIQAVRAFETAGYAVLIIDSFSHAWIGEGGVLDQADASGKEGLLKWQSPKSRYRKLVQGLMTTRMHVIFCSRAKHPMIEGKDPVTGKKTLIKGPLKPIQSADLIYELTVVAEMQGDGRYQMVKCPGPLRDAFPPDSVMDEATGTRIGRWVAGGTAIDPGFEALRIEAREAAEKGREHFVGTFWEKLTREQRGALAGDRENLKSIAQTADDERTRAKQEEEDQQNLDDPFGDKGASVTIIPASATAVQPAVERPADPSADAQAQFMADYRILLDQIEAAATVEALEVTAASRRWKDALGWAGKHDLDRHDLLVGAMDARRIDLSAAA